MTTGDATLAPRQFARNLAEFRYRESLMVGATMAVLAGAIVFFPGMDDLTAGIQADVGTTELALLFVVAVLAGVIKGTIGFGYALITTPIFASVIDPRLAVVVLAIPPWMINVFQVGETNTGLEYARREWPLLVLATVGAVAGVFVFVEISTGALVPFLIAVMILGYVVFEVVRNFITVEEAHHPVALGAAGLLEGFLLAVSNLGPLLPAYLHTFERDTERYVGGLSMVLGTVFTVRIVQLLLLGRMTTYQLWLGSTIAVVTIVGLLLGTYLRHTEIDEERFNRVVVAVLAIISLNILSKTVPKLFF